MTPKIAILFSALLLNTAAHATEPPAEALAIEEPIPEVAISSIRNPELKPYRVMAAGLDAFDEFRHLAPAATLRFRLGRRDDPKGHQGKWEDVSLRLAGGETSIPIPIQADGTLTLPRSQAAYDDEAEFITNQKKASIRFTPEVRTPGLPATVRRLGDLRLECRIIMAIGKKEMNFAMRMALNTIMLGPDWCGRGLGKFSFSLPDWSIHTSLVHEGKRSNFPTEGFSVAAPIQDKSLSDNALLEFEFWSAVSKERKQAYLAQWPVQLHGAHSTTKKWQAGPVFSEEGKGIYRAQMALEPGQMKFRLASKGERISFGGSATSAVLAPEVDFALQRQGRDLSLQVDAAGIHEFVLDLQNPDQPLLKVRPPGPVSANQ